MFHRLLDWLSRKARARAPVDMLLAGLAVEPADRDLTRIVPVILPLEMLDVSWPGPIERIGELPFCVAWATCGEMNSFYYVTEREAQYWDKKGLDWQAMALANLANMTADRPATGQKLDEEGLPFVKVLLHDDTLGPSRLLIPHLFDDILGADYEVAIPERTCAIAYRQRLSSSEASDVSNMINGCFERGTEPMSPERFDARLLWRFATRRHLP